MQQHENTSVKSSLSDQSKVTKKRHNTAATSIKAYYELIRSGQIQNEFARIYSEVEKHQPCTSRMLAGITKIERTNITRSLHDLEKAALIEIAFKGKCATTGKTVHYYRVKAVEAPQNANTASIIGDSAKQSV